MESLISNVKRVGKREAEIVLHSLTTGKICLSVYLLYIDNRRTIEWLELEGALKSHLVQFPHNKQGHLFISVALLWTPSHRSSPLLPQSACSIPGEDSHFAFIY